MLNIGYVAAEIEGVAARVHYDEKHAPAGPEQPLTNGGGGFCLEITNPDGRVGVVQLRHTGTGHAWAVGLDRSFTLDEVAAAGFATRGDVALSVHLREA